MSDTNGPGIDDWEAWHPNQAYQILQGSTVDWYVAAGWAIDLHLAQTNGGRQTRAHEDVEVAIDRADFPTWRRYLDGAGYELFDAGAGRLRRLGPTDEPDPVHHQVWLCEQTASRPVWRMDTFLEERAQGHWICHWLPSVRLPMAEAVRRTVDGIPYLRPELVLLGKAKHCRPKAEADLTLVLPTLDKQERRRLRAGLQVADAGHPWLAPLPWTLGWMGSVAAPIVLTGHIAARLLGAPVDASPHRYAQVRLRDVPVLVERARQARHQVRIGSECSGWGSLEPGHELVIGSMDAVVVAEAARPRWWVATARGELPMVGLADLLALDCWGDSDRSALARLDAALSDRGEAAHGLRPFDTTDLGS